MNPRKPPTINVEFTLHDLFGIAGTLRKEWDNLTHSVERTDWTGYQTEDISHWLVQSAENDLARRAQLAEWIAGLTGEVLAEQADTASNIAAARAAYVAQEARKAARAAYVAQEARKATEEAAREAAEALAEAE